MCLGALGDPGRDGGRVGAVSETSDDSSDHELQEAVLARDGRDLDDSTNAHDLREKTRVRKIISGERERKTTHERSEPDHLPSPEGLSDEESSERSEEAPNLVDGGDSPVNRSGVNCTRKDVKSAEVSTSA